MGITELGNALGINKSVVSRLVAKGMPTTSVQSAQAWREVYAKPRAKRGMAGIAPPAPKPIKTYRMDSPPESKLVEFEVPESPPIDTDDEVDESECQQDPSDKDNSARESRRRARLAEGRANRLLTKMQHASMEDVQKAYRVYIAARNNRNKADQDFKQWQRDEGILLFYDEAKDIASRPHIALKQMLEGGAKTIAPRLVGMPQKSIEKILGDHFAKMTEVARQSI